MNYENALFLYMFPDYQPPDEIQQMLAQAACLYWINVELMGGLVYEFGGFVLHQQGLALLALIPIWLYDGRKGRGGKLMQYGAYLYYPLHLLLLGLIKFL